MKRRVWSLFLMLAMTCAFFSALSPTAQAVGSYGVDLSNDCYSSNYNPFTAKGFKGQCTWYCWGRAYEKLGVYLYWGSSSYGNAMYWYRNAQGYYICDTTPSGNSIMVVSNGGYTDDEGYHQTGHVMFVEYIENGFAHISEANYYPTGGYDEDVINLSNGKRKSGTGASVNIIGYIHLTSPAVPIPEGVYCIRSALDDGLVVGVADDSSASGANVELKSYVRTAAQRFKIVSEDENYKIVNMNSQLPLDVSGASAEAGANVQQYVDWLADNEAQQWCFEDAGNGYYYIRSALGTYLDVQGGVTSEGQNIQTYTGNGSAAQKWKLEMISPSINSVSVPEGIYYIRSALDNNLVAGVAGGSSESGANVELACYSGAASQRFNIALTSENYHIINMESQLLLDVSEASGEAGTNVQQYVDWLADNKAQQWCFEDAGDGYYYIRSALGTYLDVQDGITSEGQNIQAYTGNGSAAQKWELELYSSVTNPETVAVSDVTLNQFTFFITVGDTATLIATVSPSDATDPTVIWTSSAFGVAAVDSSGKVTAVAPGTAIITAQAGNKTAECTVTVTPKIEYSIGELEICNTSGTALAAIPAGQFLVTVPIMKLSEDGDATVFLASYSASGQYKGLLYVKVRNVPIGATVELTFPVDNSKGDIAQLQAMVVSSFSIFMPLGAARSFPEN